MRRRDRAHPPRSRAAGRRRARARDPPRRVRAPHPLPDERPLPPELAAVEGPVVLCFGVVRPTRGSTCWSRPSARSRGAELWVVGRPLGVSMERLRRLAPPGRRALRGPLRERRRAGRLLSPRRAAGPAPTAASTCPACCSPGWPSARRWCSPTWAASASWWRTTAPAGSVPPGDPDALGAGDRRAARRRPQERALLERARARRRPRGPTRGTGSRRTTLGAVRGGARDEGVFMGKCKRSAARGARLARRSRACDVAAVVAAEPDRFTREEQRLDLVAQRHGLPLVDDEELYADPARRTWTWCSRSCSGSASASR